MQYESTYIPPVYMQHIQQDDSSEPSNTRFGSFAIECSVGRDLASCNGEPSQSICGVSRGRVTSVYPYMFDVDEKNAIGRSSL